MNGILPTPPDDLGDTKKFRQWVVDRLMVMPCIQHDRDIRRIQIFLGALTGLVGLDVAVRLIALL